MWVLLIYVMTRFRHPGPLNDVTPLDMRSRVLSVLALVVMLMCFMPVPVVPAGLLK
ncbi:MAG: hypothetical protein GXO65_05950 [Euryarchaeota archaeon]|nr:hypothetical protein [Euryarchaeota archaeon]